MALTDAKVRAAKPAAKAYKLTDERGLHLYVTPAGGRYWRLRVQVAGKERLSSLGQYPAMSLAEARQRRDQVRGGTGRPAAPTFRTLAGEWHAINRPRWTARHADDVLQSLESAVYPTLGDRPVDQITAGDVLAALRAVEGRGAIETAHRIRQRIEAVLAYAMAADYVAGNVAIQVKPALAPVTARGRQPAVTELAEAREVLRRAEAIPAHPVTRLALRLLALTAVRPGELRGAAWPEFEGLDGAAPLWRIPAARMKMRIEHLVPLAPAAVTVLEAVRRFAQPGGLVFPSARSVRHPLSENAIGYLLNRAGYHGRHVPHGWRATFSTVLNERFPADRATIDLMLAHAPRNAVEAAYNRASHLARRRELACLWADLLLDGLPPAAELLALRRKS